MGIEEAIQEGLGDREVRTVGLCCAVGKLMSAALICSFPVGQQLHRLQGYGYHLVCSTYSFVNKWYKIL